MLSIYTKNKRKGVKIMRKLIRIGMILMIFMTCFYSLGTQAASYVRASKRDLGWSSKQMSNAAVLMMNDEPVFCIQPHQFFSTTDPYEVVSERPSWIDKDELKKIALYAYYGTEYKTGDKWYITAQGMIWHTLGESWDSCIVDFKDGSTSESMMKELKYLVDTHTTLPSFSDTTLEINVDEPFIISDEAGVLNRFDIEGIEGIDFFKEGNTLTILASSNSGKEATVQLVNKANTDKGTNLYYTTWGTSISGSDGWQRCGKLYVKDPVYASFKLKINHYQEPQFDEVEVTKSKEDKGVVNFTKLDEFTNQGLSDVVVDIYMDDRLIGEAITTNDQGMIELAFSKSYNATSQKITYVTNYEKLSPENKEKYKAYHLSKESALEEANHQVEQRLNQLIQEASYTFKVVEQKTKTGYVFDENKAIVSQTTSDNDIYLTLTNTACIGKITLIKEDSLTGNTPQGDACLNDAIYDLYAANDIYHPDGKSGLLYKKDEVIASFLAPDYSINDLYYGNYYIKERVAPTGYELSTEIIPISLDTPIVSVKATDAVIKAKLTIQKMMKDDALEINQPLKDIQFEIKLKSEVEKLGWQNANLSATLITDHEGYASTTLPYGTYILKEINPPIYVKESKDIEIEINSSKDVFYEIINQPIKGEIKIMKMDAKTNQLILDTQTSFKIKNLDTDEYLDQMYTTDKSGCISVILPYGHYQLEEIQTNPSYTLNTEPYLFEITEDKTIEIPFINTAIEGQLTIKKIGKIPTQDLKPLENAVFTLRAATDFYSPDHQGTILYHKGDVIQTLTTDFNGISTINNLPLGQYFLQETTAPTGFMLDTKNYAFEITPSKTEVTFTLENKRPTISLDLTKVLEFDLYHDEDAYQEITFGLYLEDGTFIKEYALDKDGHLKDFAQLPQGNYYLQELTSPPRYQLDTTLYPFTIGDYDQNISQVTISINDGNPIINYLKRKALEVKKVDESNPSLGLADAKIALYDEDMNLLQTLSTNQEGLLQFDNLEYGTYYVQEIEAPIGYELNNEVYEIHLNDDSVPLVIKNKQEIILKTGDSFQPTYYLVALTLASCCMRLLFIKKKKKVVD